ncbi:MAG: ABC transporter permease [Rubrobacteraceae bacterium]
MFASTHNKKKQHVSGAVGNLYKRRWLVVYFIRRELARSYQSSFLGFFWMLLTPLLMVALYTLIFSEIIGLRFRVVEGDSSLNFGLYLYCGLIPFLTFAGSLSQSTNSIKGNANLVQKVVFPVEILPLSITITNFVTNTFGLGVLVAVLAVLERRLEWTLVLLPLLMIVQLIFTLGLSYLAAVVGTYLPDLRGTIQAITRAMFFVTPIIWPADRVEGTNFEFIVAYNPLAVLVEAYRNLVLDGEIPASTPILLFTLFSVVLFLVGFALFVRAKRQFADLI